MVASRLTLHSELDSDNAKVATAVNISPGQIAAQITPAHAIPAIVSTVTPGAPRGIRAPNKFPENVPTLPAAPATASIASCSHALKPLVDLAAKATKIVRNPVPDRLVMTDHKHVLASWGKGTM